MEKSVNILDKLQPVGIVLQTNKLTQEGQVKWHSVPVISPDSLGLARLGDDPNVIISEIFEGRYKNNKLRFIIKSSKYFIDNSQPTVSATLNSILKSIHVDKETGSRYYWVQTNFLALVDDEGKVVWSVNGLPLLKDLEASIRYQSSDPVLRTFVEDIFSADLSSK